MRFMAPNEDYGGDAVEINMSPLIDMVFLLLIFFMVTTAFVTRSALDIEPPAATTAVTAPVNAVIFSITAAGDILFDDKIISLAAVPGIYKRQAPAGIRPAVVIADRRSETGLAVAVLDACRAAGAESTALATSAATESK